jgi:KUP system potassium uptake protein
MEPPPGKDPEAAPASPRRSPPRGRYLVGLSLAALGVVYGDIGTSPLYAIRECFHGDYGIAVTRENILGVLSLIIWSLILVVSIKYLVLVLQADNRGEGGILALMSLVIPARWTRDGRNRRLAVLGLLGAALLYGDGMITPSISVLSATEGLEVAAPALRPYAIPVTLVILVLLFSVQRRGTAGVGTLFGPVTLVWFLALAALGAPMIAREPHVLAAANPAHAAIFLWHNAWHGMLVLAAVFLVVTGAEALYADMGHFGTRPIRLAWFGLVAPALLVNYLGQGALLIMNPEAAHNPFYRLAPPWALYPLIGLATLATVIASQAIISGAFSLTRQAVQLGYSPRVPITHTSSEEIGQVYVAPVNWGLLVACCLLVLSFGSSSKLAAAYGMAVSLTMVLTTLLFYVLLRDRWRWSRRTAGALVTVLLMIDVSFFGANVIKIGHGGWFPLVVGTAAFIVMGTWKRGRHVLRERLRASSLPLDQFLESLEKSGITRVPGTAVFMTGDTEGTPHAMLHNIKHNRVVHQQVILLTVITADVPYVPPGERLKLEFPGQGFCRVVMQFGFMQDPNVPAALTRAGNPEFPIDPQQTTYFLGREKLIPTRRSGMARWRERLFAFLSRNASSATAFFRLPPNRVVELGAQIEL